METKKLNSCTFIIPLKIEHPDRYRNAKTVLGFLNNHFETNVFIYEISEGDSKLDFLEDLKNIKIKHWLEKQEESFHRTKYLNIMLDDVETPVVCNYDIDVILNPNVYIECQELILNSEYDVLYPYHFGANQRRVNDSLDYEGFARSEYDINFIDNSGCAYNWDSEYGHCIFFNTSFYKKYGAENENFISYAPEDVERGLRFKKIGLRVHWLPHGLVYHFEHYRGPDSSGLNPFFQKNWDLFNVLNGMNLEQTIDYYKTVDYLNKYKTIGYEKNISNGI